MQSYSISQAASVLARDRSPWMSLETADRTISYSWLDSAPNYSAGNFGPVSQGFKVFTAAQQTAANRALELWSDIANISFRFEDNDSLAQLRFGSTSAPGTGGFAYTPGSSPIVNGDIWLPIEQSNVQDNIGSAAAPNYGQYGFLVFLHEIGHALDLLHPGSYNGGRPTYSNNAAYNEDSLQYSVMSYFSASNTGASHSGKYAQTPLLHDIAAIQQLYGVNTATRTGDTTYGFNSNAGRDVFNFSNNSTPIVTIWDAGGTDTLDVSGFNNNSIIDLREGGFSDVGGLKHNVSIAQGAVIENATGGNAAETIYGNNASNHLKGGGGNDKFYNVGGTNNIIDGGAGSDILYIAQNQSEYSARQSGGDVILTGLNTTNTLRNVENIDFNGTQVTVQSLLSSSSAPVISISDYEATEANVDSNHTIRVNLNKAATQNVTFNYTVQSISAVAGEDYVFNNGSATIAQGNSHIDISFVIKGDTVLENNETFKVTLSNPANATISSINNSATITINNDDTQIRDDYGNNAANASTTLTVPNAGVSSKIYGQLETIGDHDWFKVSLAANSHYIIDTDGLDGSGGSLVDSVLRLRDSSGNIVSINDDDGNGRDSSISFKTAGSAADYYIDVGAYGDFGTGSYRLNLQRRDTSQNDDIGNDRANATTITLNGTGFGNKDAKIDFAGDRDWYKVSLADATKYTIDLSKRGDNGLDDSYLRIYNASGTLLKQDDDGGNDLNARLVFNANHGGGSAADYYIEAAGYNDIALGDYGLSIQKLDTARDSITATTATSGRVNAGSSVTSSSIDFIGDHDWFKIGVVSGTSYVFDVKGADSDKGSLIDSVLKLYDTNGTTLLGTADNGGIGLDSRMIYTATATKDVYLDVGAYNNGYTGSYEVSARTFIISDDHANNKTNATEIIVGNSKNGVINKNDDKDWFKVDLVKGTTYEFDLTQRKDNGMALKDGYLELYNSAGDSILAKNDNGGRGFDARIVFTATESATYHLVAQSAKDTSGNHKDGGGYQLSASAIFNVDDFGSSTNHYGRLLDLGGAYGNQNIYGGNIDYGGDKDWFGIKLTQNKQYEFRAIGENSDNGTGGFGNFIATPKITLFDKDGDPVGSPTTGSDGVATHKYTAGASDIYFIQVSSDAATDEGEYRLVTTQTAGADGNDTYDNATTLNISTAANDKTLSQTIGKEGDLDWYKITISQTGTYEITMKGDNGNSNPLTDAYLTLYKTNGEGVVDPNDNVLILTRDDNGGYSPGNGDTAFREAYGDSAITYQFTQTGTYYLQAKAANQYGFGDYKINIKAKTATSNDIGNTKQTATSLSNNTPITSSIDHNLDEDVFKFSVDGNGRAVLQIEDVGDFDNLELRIFQEGVAEQIGTTFPFRQSRGNISLSNPNDSPITFYAIINGLSDTGDYKITLNPPASMITEHDDGVIHNITAQMDNITYHSAILASQDIDDGRDYHHHFFDQHGQCACGQHRGESFGAEHSGAVGNALADYNLLVLRATDNALDNSDFSYSNSRDKNISLANNSVRLIDKNGSLITPSEVTKTSDISLTSIDSTASGAAIKAGLNSFINGVASGKAGFARVEFRDGIKATVMYYNSGDSGGKGNLFTYLRHLDNRDVGLLDANNITGLVDNGAGSGSEFSLRVDRQFIREGDSDRDVSVFIERSGDISKATSIDYFVGGSGANSVDAVDFVGNILPRGRVEFASGQSSARVDFKIKGDQTIERDEDFTFNLNLVNNIDMIKKTHEKLDMRILTDERPQADFDQQANGAIESNLFTFGNDISGVVNGGGGNDHYIVTSYQMNDVRLNDQSGNNHVYFDHNVTVTSVKVAGVGTRLEIALDNGHKLMMGAGYKDFTFHIGNSNGVNYTTFLTQKANGFKVNDYVDISKITGISNSSHTDFFKGDALDNQFALNSNHKIAADGGNGRDSYIITRFFAGSEATINDTGTDNSKDEVIFDAGVAIDSFSHDTSNNKLTVNLTGGKKIYVLKADEFAYRYEDEAPITLQKLLLNPSDFSPHDGAYLSQGVMKRGSDGNDILQGSQDNDMINGYAGNDTIKAYSGNDILSGGDGNDQFIFEYHHSSNNNQLSWNHYNGRDHISDFNNSQNGDSLKFDGNLNAQNFKDYFNDYIDAKINDNILTLDFNDGGQLKINLTENISSSLYNSNNGELNDYDAFLTAIGGSDSLIFG